MYNYNYIYNLTLVLKEGIYSLVQKYFGKEFHTTKRAANIDHFRDKFESEGTI